MINKTLLNYNFQPGDRIFHPRLGPGQVLRREDDGKCVVKFDRQCKKDAIYPGQLVLLNSITRFILTTYCPTCEQRLDVDLTIMGDTALPGFRNLSLFPQGNADVQVGESSSGTPKYIHRSCGQQLEPEKARPVV